MLKRSLLLMFWILSGLPLFSQNGETKDTSRCRVQLNIGTDLVSSYIWRGSEIDGAPAIQPFLSLSAGNFELGAWGSVAVTGSYKEVDLYAKYSLSDFSVTLTDYYVPGTEASPASPDTRFFIYQDAVTAHTLEGTLQYKREEKVPFWVSGSVFFYGNDKRWGYDEGRDSTDQTYYSSYFEAGYAFEVRKIAAEVFAGFTPAAGAYGNTLGVVNAGITGYRNIPVTPEFELPLKASLVFNPQRSAVFFVVGITIQ